MCQWNFIILLNLLELHAKMVTHLNSCHILNFYNEFVNVSSYHSTYLRFFIVMFLRMLTVHCDQNDSYETTINSFQVRKINEIRNIIFGLRYGKPSSALRSKLGCSPSWVLNEISSSTQLGEHPNLGLKGEEGFP